ncbi:MAG: hypothetical protein ABNH38_03635 [Tateyamaria sp.]|jgi:uncharacterized membrane protein YgaE (UPF0421/DUF939 family)|uniref:hypothetical protein n=1 Tax=Tateyamaria sp. TaxID=1929288 RepID=UPI0032DD9E68
MIATLALQSIGIPAGTFIGVLLGLGMRRRSGKTDGLLGGSLLLTAAVAALIAWVVAIAVNYFIGSTP